MNDWFLLNFREFVFGNIETNIENVVTNTVSNCKNCFADVKKDIAEFFDYIDCDRSGSASAEELHKAFKNMKTDFPLDTTMINDFTMKADEPVTATLDKKSFVYAILMAMYERVIKDHEVNTDGLYEDRNERKALVMTH